MANLCGIMQFLVYFVLNMANLCTALTLVAWIKSLLRANFVMNVSSSFVKQKYMSLHRLLSTGHQLLGVQFLTSLPSS